MISNALRYSAAIVCALLLAAPTAGAETGNSLAWVDRAPDLCVELRQEAVAEAAAVGCLPGGTAVVILASAPGWKEVRTETGRRGWMPEEDLAATRPEPATGPAPEAVPTAAAEPVARPSEPETGDLPPGPETGDQPREPETGDLPPEPTTGEPLPGPEPETRDPARPTALETLTRERDDLRLRLGAAEAQITALRADLGATRAALESSQAERAELDTRLETARADLAALTAELRSAEARQIFLLSELEESRAEVRRLERLAAVPPAPTPAPDPSPPAPREPVAPPEAPTDPGAVAAAEREEVLGMLRAWAQAWSEQRVDDYLAFYSSEFRPADGSARSDWEAWRRERVSQPSTIEVSLDQIFVQVEGDLARAGLRQTYRSDSFGDVVSKTLLLRREAGSWKILEETAAP